MNDVRTESGSDWLMAGKIPSLRKGGIKNDILVLFHIEVMIGILEPRIFKNRINEDVKVI